MKLEHASPRWLKTQIKRAVGKYLDLKKYNLFLFGSRVAGDSFEHSDIDIGIEGARRVSYGTIAKIEEELEEIPVLYTIDLIDFRSTDSRFKKVAKKHIEIIN